MHLTLSSFSLVSFLFSGAPGPAGHSAGEPAFAAAPGSPYFVGPMAGRPVLGDMDRDGRLDIVVACGTCCGSKPSPESGHVAVLLNRGKEGFTGVKGPRVTVGPSVPKVALADVNADGKLDVLCAEHDTYNVTVLLGDGSGNLSKGPGSTVAAAAGTRPHTHEIAAADLNADGYADVLTTNANDNTISVLLGDGRAGFKPAAGSPFAAGRHPYDALAIADFTGDGKLDVAAPLLAAAKIGALRGDGTGLLAQSDEDKYVVGPRPGYVAAADVNGDGKPDIVASHDDVGMIDVLLNDGTGRFKPAAGEGGSPVMVPPPAWGIAPADMNGDGKCDLVLGAFESAPVLLIGDGKGGFTDAGLKLESGSFPNYVAVGDVSGDGLPDIVTGNYGSGDVSVFVQVKR
jgi:hypothetical protein